MNIVRHFLVGGFILFVAALPMQAQRYAARGVRAALRGPQLTARVEKQVVQKQAQAAAREALPSTHLFSKAVYPIGQGVFCARPQRGNDPFSGGVFQVIRNGKKEIFGFVAAHSLAELPTDQAGMIDAQYSLHRSFSLDMLDINGKPHTVQGEVVQLSSPRLLDVALVKFRPEDEKLFTPFLLRKTPVKEGEELQFYGFSDGGDAFFTREVLAQTPLSLRTDMHWPRDSRPGFCGGAVLDGEQRLVGVHTGSNRSASWASDIGYATHAGFLNVLVEAYHNEGKATFPLELDGRKMIDLAPNEYVAEIDALDKEAEKIGSVVVPYKFSYSHLKEMIASRHPRYLRFFLGRIDWAVQNPEYVQERSYTREVVYDIKKHRVVSKTGR